MPTDYGVEGGTWNVARVAEGVPRIVQFGACGLRMVGDAGGDGFNGFDGGDAGEGGHLGRQRLGREGAAEVAVEFGDAAAAAIGIRK